MYNNNFKTLHVVKQITEDWLFHDSFGVRSLTILGCLLYIQDDLCKWLDAGAELVSHPRLSCFHHSSVELQPINSSKAMQSQLTGEQMLIIALFPTEDRSQMLVGVGVFSVQRDRPINNQFPRINLVADQLPTAVTPWPNHNLNGTTKLPIRIMVDHVRVSWWEF